ncbi:MAG: ABC transporter ATP-binding protein [Spirochaetota bacterium]|nr:ABC transporter ATP-binding protein [Spirochaetota bacterium]
MLEVENLEKIYGYGKNALRVLEKVSLRVEKGEIVSIIGPSGAGKSTLLNMIGCIDGFNSGKLMLLGKDVSNLTVDELSGFRNRHVGFIFQFHNLLNEFTVLENIMIPLLIRRVPNREANRRVKDIIERFNLSQRIHYKPTELSGGECQRIAVARAIVGNPDIVLADEPTGNLDSVNSRILTDTLLDLVRENNTTIIIVTHDKDIAAMTDRTITLVDGNILQDEYNIKRDEVLHEINEGISIDSI